MNQINEVWELTAPELKQLVSQGRKTARCMAWLLIACVIAIGALSYGMAKQEAVIQSQDALVKEQDVLIIKKAARIKELEAEVAVIKTEAVKTVSRASEHRRLTLDEVRALAAVVHAESKGERFEGKMMVAKVAINRHRWNPGLSMREILENPHAFAAPENPNSEDVRAVYEALADRRFDHVAGFHNPATATADDAKEHKILFVIGNHSFW